MQEHWRNPSIAARHSKQCLWMPVDACACVLVCVCVCARGFSGLTRPTQHLHDRLTTKATTKPAHLHVPHCHTALCCAALRCTAQQEE